MHNAGQESAGGIRPIACVAMEAGFFCLLPDGLADEGVGLGRILDDLVGFRERDSLWSFSELDPLRDSSALLQKPNNTSPHLLAMKLSASCKKDSYVPNTSIAQVMLLAALVLFDWCCEVVSTMHEFGLN